MASAEADAKAACFRKDGSRRDADWCENFARNSDDCFKMGIAVSRRSTKLYSDFYRCDIIVASPLGLRLSLGAEGDREKDRDRDFLSSIEMVVVDQACAMLMQNWQHVHDIFSVLNLQPKIDHGADFTRIRHYFLDSLSKYYRQTIVVSSVEAPEVNSVFSNHCRNLSGVLRVNHAPDSAAMRGSITRVVPQIKQIFQRISISQYKKTAKESAVSALPPIACASEARFAYFKNVIFPRLVANAEAGASGTLLFVPSYFDYVRVRKLFRKEENAFGRLRRGALVAPCDEYTDVKSIASGRSHFYNGRIPILMYTERNHYFRRYRLKGIRHIVFYQAPLHSRYYADLLNQVNVEDGNTDVLMLYTRYDAIRLQGIISPKRTKSILKGSKEMHMFM